MSDAAETPSGQSWPITLEQFCRALAAQVMLSTYAAELHGPLAPKRTEAVARLIHSFALGHPIARPTVPGAEAEP